MKEPNF
jgi:hypothetical protein